MFGRMYADGNHLAILVDGGTMKLARPIRTDPEPAHASGGRKMETRYRWDYLTGACLSEVNDQGETTVQYNNHPQNGALISERSDGEDIYHHYDGDGNTRQTTDSAGNVLGEATYDAFGETVAESGDLKTTHRFRGQHGYSTDPLTGDVSKANQNYGPSLGRSLSLASCVERLSFSSFATSPYSRPNGRWSLSPSRSLRRLRAVQPFSGVPVPALSASVAGKIAVGTGIAFEFNAYALNSNAIPVPTAILPATDADNAGTGTPLKGCTARSRRSERLGDRLQRPLGRL